MKNTLSFAAITMVFCSCSSTNLMSLSVLEPAPVSIPSNIKSIAVVNRSKVSDESKVVDQIHKVLSLKTNDLQAAGANSGLQGLTDELSKNNRFTNINPLKRELKSFGAGVFPTALPWDSVIMLCRESHTDALFSLEVFDTESKINYAANPSNVNLGVVNLPAIEHHVNMTTFVKTGWRIYDPATKTILDEYMIGRNISFSGSGINPAAAAAALIGRKEAVKDVAGKAGEAYATRIIPYWIRVSRDYFVRGNDQFQTARRKAQSGNWDGAAKIWEQETGNPDGKLAGRACYNMAIISEIDGDLDAAISWARRSYEDHQISLALKYLNILRYRKQQNEVLKSQTLASLN